MCQPSEDLQGWQKYRPGFITPRRIDKCNDKTLHQTWYKMELSKCISTVEWINSTTIKKSVEATNLTAMKKGVTTVATSEHFLYVLGNIWLL